MVISALVIYIRIFILQNSTTFVYLYIAPVLSMGEIQSRLPVFISQDIFQDPVRQIEIHPIHAFCDLRSLVEAR